MSRGPNRPALVALLIAGSAALGACTGEQRELREWMDEVRRNTQPIRETIAEPKRFEPFRYDEQGQIDPFSQVKLTAALDRLSQRAASGPRPDLDRRREPLESFPLESIHLVGNLSNGRANLALLQVDTVVYQAGVGSYAGQNYGKITRVTENEVTLKELVQDAAGDWVERETSLRLQESKK